MKLRTNKDYEDVLQVEESISSVVWEIKGGIYINKLKKMLKRVKDEKPAILIIEIGSNDLTKSFPSPPRFAVEVVKLAEHWTKQVPEIQKLVVCQVTNKADITCSSKSMRQFNDDVELYNQNLCRMLKSKNRIIHWRHKRLYRTLDEATDDGTHLDTDEGKLRYKKSMYGAIREACRQIRRGCDARQGRKTRNQTELEGSSLPAWLQLQRYGQIYAPE